ncbi:MAG: HAD-IB family phosphatase [Deltaproteobacteria bacterium]|nr:HAD-IB family phosphatase [Deltaproteobacteria bacterium]
MALVFIDLDGTLIKEKSSERCFFFFLLRKRILRIPQIIAFLSFAGRYLPQYGNIVWKKNKAYLAGLGEEEIMAAARAFVREDILNSIRPEMKERIIRHRLDSDEAILLTGSLSYLAKPVADHVGINQVSATICTAQNGRLDSLPPLVHPFHLEKRQIAKAICQDRGISLTDCTAYGDSIHDLPLLEAVGRPVAVHPDRRLKKIARRRSWEIL